MTKCLHQWVLLNEIEHIWRCGLCDIKRDTTPLPKKSKKPKEKPHYRNTAMGTCVCNNAHVEDLEKSKKVKKGKVFTVKEIIDSYRYYKKSGLQIDYLVYLGIVEKEPLPEIIECMGAKYKLI